MLIHLMKTNSEKNRVLKVFKDGTKIIEGALKKETSIINPVVLIEIEFDEGATWYNYAYINDFNRWYFVDNIVSVRNHLWEYHLSVDVLYTYRSSILKSTALLNSATTVKSHGSLYNKDQNTYLNSSKYVSTVKASTEIKRFPNALLDQGEWILVTAGGQ